MGNAYATDQLCAVVPTCEELGYTDTSCPEGSNPLKCPLDLTKLRCGSTTPSCTELGYTDTSCSEGSNPLKCPFDQTKLHCGASTIGCEELGYTETDCGENLSLKCPFDTSKMHCIDEKCEPGSFYYSDNTCRSIYLSDKTVVGIVVRNNLFISISGNNTYAPWMNAKNACYNRTVAGKHGRLPTRAEGTAICQYSNIYASLAEISAQQLPNGARYWTTDDNNSSSGYAYFFQFYEGGCSSMRVPLEAQASYLCVFDF